MLPEELDLEEEAYIAYKLTDTMMLLSPKEGVPHDSLLLALGNARQLKTKKNTVKLDRQVCQKVAWEDEWEIFIFSSFEDYVLMGVPALDEMDYLEMRGIPAVVSLPMDNMLRKRD